MADLKHYINGNVLSLGTVSHATLRDEDLIAAFNAELWKYRTAPTNLMIEARAWLEGIPAYCSLMQVDERQYEEDASHLVAELMDDLNHIAPEGVYFGNTEGDGSDFGWWEMDLEVED